MLIYHIMSNFNTQLNISTKECVINFNNETEKLLTLINQLVQDNNLDILEYNISMYQSKLSLAKKGNVMKPIEIYKETMLKYSTYIYNRNYKYFYETYKDDEDINVILFKFNKLWNIVNADIQKNIWNSLILMTVYAENFNQ